MRIEGLNTGEIMAALFGGIEAGTSQFVCAVGDGLGGLNRFIRFETTTPEETLGRAVQFFERQAGHVEAVGVGAFTAILAAFGRFSATS